MTLPGGFSPTQAIRQIADKVNPFDGTNTDYNVFSEKSFDGGARDATGAVQPGWVLGANGGYNYTAPAATTAPTAPNTTPTNTNSDPATIAAQQATARADAAKRAGYSVSANNQTGAARQSLTDVGNTYDKNTNTFVNDVTTGQDTVNRGLAGNELNLRRSMQNIIRSIQSGIRSGGVALAGMNASDSGAADAMARAYAKSGNEQSGEARGQAGTAFEDLQRQQGALDLKRNQGEADLGTWQNTETNRVRGDFGGKIDALAADAEANGMGGVIEKSVVDQVLNEALSRLSQIDQSRQQKLGGVKQWTPDEIMAEAIRQDQLGAAGNAFTTTGPEVSYGGNTGMPINGAVMGEMPIYVKGKDQGISSIPLTRTKQEQAMA